MEYCKCRIIEIEDEEGILVKCIVPELENIKVMINPDPKDDSEYYIIL